MDKSHLLQTEMKNSPGAQYKTNSFIFLLKLKCIRGDLLCVINTEGIMALMKLTLILLCKNTLLWECYVAFTYNQEHIIAMSGEDDEGKKRKK